VIVASTSWLPASIGVEPVLAGAAATPNGIGDGELLSSIDCTAPSASPEASASVLAFAFASASAFTSACR
jgi:hypothetical protein